MVTKLCLILEVSCLENCKLKTTLVVTEQDLKLFKQNFHTRIIIEKYIILEIAKGDFAVILLL